MVVVVVVGKVVVCEELSVLTVEVVLDAVKGRVIVVVELFT